MLRGVRQTVQGNPIFFFASRGCIASRHDDFSNVISPTDSRKLENSLYLDEGYASSSEVQAPFISPSDRCYHRVSDSEADCSAAYEGRSRICLCSSPCLAGYYGTSSQCRRCPRRLLELIRTKWEKKLILKKKNVRVLSALSIEFSLRCY
jgi:hypothetical protein